MQVHCVHRVVDLCSGHAMLEQEGHCSRTPGCGIFSGLWKRLTVRCPGKLCFETWFVIFPFVVQGTAEIMNVQRPETCDRETCTNLQNMRT